MKKRTLVLILLGLIISLTAFFVVRSIDTDVLEQVSIPQSKEKSTIDQEADIKKHHPEEQEKQEERMTEQFKDFITDAVQSTIDFFRNKDIRFLAIGDSLTQGIGDETDQGGYVGILDRTIHASEQRMEVTFDNFGKRGNRTDQLLARLDEQDIQQSMIEADIILITIGANDIMEVFKQNFTNLTIEPFQEERHHFEQRLHQIFTKIRDTNKHAHIYLLGIYNPFAQYFQEIEELEIIVNEWNRTSSMIANQFNHATFIPIKDLFENTNVNLFADDNFHPNRQGYERMAERVLDYLTATEE